MPLLGGGDGIGTKTKGSSIGLVPGSSLADDNGNFWLSDASPQSRSGLSVAMGGIGDEGGASYGGERLVVELQLPSKGLVLDFEFERGIVSSLWGQ